MFKLNVNVFKNLVRKMVGLVMFLLDIIFLYILIEVWYGVGILILFLRNGNEFFIVLNLCFRFIDVIMKWIN